MKFVFFDLETTGLNEDDEIIEIGAIKVVDFEVVSTFKTLVRPNKVLPRFITNLTGITPQDLDKAQDKEKVKKEFKAFIEDSILVAHNASFDISFLTRFFESPIENKVIDTLELARLIYPELQSHSLEKLVSSLNIKRQKAHRAFNDAMMLYELFNKILEEKNAFLGSDLNALKNIIGNIRDFDFLFDKVDENASIDIKPNYGSDVLTLPFKERASVSKSGIYYSNKDINSVISSIEDFGFSLVVYYSDEVKEAISLSKPNLNIFDATQLENFICIDRFMFYLENPNLIPDELKMDFAILSSYILKTKDFLLTNAPPHILKSKTLKNISFCNTKDCKYKDNCPIVKKLEMLKKSDVVITKMSSFLNNYRFILDFGFDSLIFFEAYRLPRVFYTQKSYYSENDLDMIAKRNNFNSVNSLFDNYSLESNKETIEKIFENNLTPQGISFEDYSINAQDRILSVSKNNPYSFFSNLKNKFKSIYFYESEIFFNGKNILENFSSLSGQLILSDRRDFKTIDIIPLFMHSPNASEFTNEFFEIYEGLSNIKPALFVFENKTQMKNIKLELMKQYPSIEESVTNEQGLFEFSTYELPIKQNYKIIFLFKLPFNVAGLSEEYAMFYAKNFILDNISKDDKSVIIYFDGRLKDKNFVNKVNDLFIGSPLFMEKKENLLQFVKKFLSL